MAFEARPVTMISLPSAVVTEALSDEAGSVPCMERELPTVYDDAGREVDRTIYWGQKQLGEEIDATGVQVGELLRELGLLQVTAKEPTSEAIAAGAGIMANLREVKDGPARYPLWNRELVVDRLREAWIIRQSSEVVKDSAAPKKRVVFRDEPSLVSRVLELERRMAELERRVG